MRSHNVLQAFVLVGLLAACGSDSETSQPPSQPQQQQDAASSGAICDEPEQQDLSGTWAVLARYQLRLHTQPGALVSMCPAEQVAEAVMPLLVVFEHEPGAASASARVVPCGLSLPSITAVVGDCDPSASNLLTINITFPDALLERLPLVASDTPVAAELGQNGALHVARAGFTWGARAGADDLPGWVADRAGCTAADTQVGRGQPCESACVETCDELIDDDVDGYPGATLHLCGSSRDDVQAGVQCHADDPSIAGMTVQGRLPAVFHTELEFVSTASSSCEIKGTFESRTNYALVGADAYVAGTPIAVASAIQSLPTFEADASASRFRMVRVDGRFESPDWQLDASGANVQQACEAVRQRISELE